METPAQFYRYAVPCAQPEERADIKLQSACRPAARRAQKQHARGGTSKRVIDTGTAFVYYLTWHREKNRGTCSAAAVAEYGAPLQLAGAGDGRLINAESRANRFYNKLGGPL